MRGLDLWNLLFIGGSSPLITLTPSPTLTSDHLPAIPAMDSIMVAWEHHIANYICDMIDTPGPHYLFPTSVEFSTPGGMRKGNGKEPTVKGSETPMVGRTPLFLSASRSPSPMPPLSSACIIPNVIDLIMVDDNDNDLLESQEESDASPSLLLPPSDFLFSFMVPTASSPSSFASFSSRSQ
ncbi:hypothetical protein F5879DRAFT_995032 [Lentinula edodes]|nr:hypothetical protein F5879DRAFT_995032 [Lentinula edodes]